ncbi:hypothetical protein chiPu_0004873 [Chiloscyllium punctatum]|uniref:Uncharacterized protein n=1 Tax=Chiloscyllium punctatum TaxID=137246 RepID=A0A401S7V1_CHIPU|nr:hypothetical protein [Chiloscyllium punctatum]
MRCNSRAFWVTVPPEEGSARDRPVEDALRGGRQQIVSGQENSEAERDKLSNELERTVVRCERKLAGYDSLGKAKEQETLMQLLGVESWSGTRVYSIAS